MVIAFIVSTVDVSAQGTCLLRTWSGWGLLRCPDELDSGVVRPEGVRSTLQLDSPLRTGWSALRVGMSEADVNRLLGTPDRVEGGGAEPNRWMWGQPGAKGGWVAFDPGARTVKEWRTF